MPRRSLLPVFGVLTAALTLSCSDAVLSGGMARVAFEPRFSQHDGDILKSLRTFGLGVTSLKVQLRRPNASEVLAEKTVTLADDATEVEVSLDVAISGTEELLVASLEMYSGEVLIFSGTVNVLAKAGADPTTARPELQLAWVGPGSQATRVVISPRDRNLSSINGRLVMTAAAFDVQGAPVTDPDFTTRIRWTVNDTTLGTLPLGGGEFVARGKTGVAIISVLTPNLLRDTVRLTLQSVLPLSQVNFARRVEVLDRDVTAPPVPVAASDPNGTPVTNATFTYVSRNPGIATVSSTGAITGVTRGQTVIVVQATEPGNTTIARDSLLAVVAEPGAPVLISSVDRFSYGRDALVTISVFMDMRSATQRLGSTTVDLQWNPGQLLYQSHANPASVVPTVNASLAASEGVLTLAMADVTGFTGRVELLRITFRTSSSATLGTLSLLAREVSAANFADLLASTVQVTHAISVP